MFRIRTIIISILLLVIFSSVNEVLAGTCTLTTSPAQICAQPKQCTGICIGTPPQKVPVGTTITYTIIPDTGGKYDVIFKSGFPQEFDAGFVGFRDASTGVGPLSPLVQQSDGKPIFLTVDIDNYNNTDIFNAGSHDIVIKKSDGTVFCQLKYDILTAETCGAAGVGGLVPVAPTALKCDPTQAGCTTAKGGDQCDPDTGQSGSGGIMTAVGCVPIDPPVLISKLITISSLIGGGIALLLMIIGAFHMITSAGNPEGVKHGQEQFMAAVIGLIFIILAVSLMKILGADILDIPGFG